MTAAEEVVREAMEAGLIFELTDKQLLVKGDRGARAEFAPRVAPLARDIAALLRAKGRPARAHLVAIPPTAAPEASGGPAASCTIGGGSPDPCPACRYTHSSLADLPACTDCGSTVWWLSVVEGDGLGRRCVACVRKGQGAGKVETPRTSQATAPAAAAAAESNEIQ